MAYEKTLPDGSPVMTEGQFAVAYIKSLQEAGDDVKTENVVASWHAYQRNPAGHFLSKENQVKASLPAEQGAAPEWQSIPGGLQRLVLPDAAQGEPLPFAWFVQTSGFGPFIECEPFQAGAFPAYRKTSK